MGIINLPSYEATAVEQRVAPQENPAFSGMAAAGAAKGRLMETLFKGATGVSETLINAAKTNQMNKAIIDYSRAQQEQLLALEKAPVTSLDPRYNELSDDEKVAPNLAVFNQWKAKYMGQAIDSIGIPAVKQQFQKYADDKGLAETEALAKFDISTSRAVGRQQLSENLRKAEEAGNRLDVMEVVENSIKAGFLNEAEANEARSKAFERISSREYYVKTLTMPVAVVPETRVAIDPPTQSEGMIKTGNVDLNATPIVRNADGSISTVRSISISEDVGKVKTKPGAPQAGDQKGTVEVLIPTIGPDGKQMSDEEAIAEYKKTGRNLGTFKDRASADSYAKALSSEMDSSIIPAQESGLQFLADINNLKYVDWDGKEKTVSLAEQENLIRQYRTYLQEVRIQRDTFYSDVHIRADSLDKIDQALGMLAQDRTLSGTQKYEWEVRFQRKQEYYLGLLNLRGKDAAKAHEDAQKAYYDQLRGKLAVRIARFPNDTGGLRDMIDDAFGKNFITGAHTEDLMKEYATERAPEYKLAMKMMEGKVSKLPEEKQWAAMAQLDSWYRDASHKIAPKIAEVEAAMNNILNEELNKAVNLAFPGIISTTAEGGLTGVAGERVGEIEKQIPVAVGYGNANWKGLNLYTGFSDTMNEYGFGEGALILLSRDKERPYAFKMDGKELKLYTLTKTRGGQDVWQEVQKAPKSGVSAGETALIAADIDAKGRAEQDRKAPDRFIESENLAHDKIGGWYYIPASGQERKYLPSADQSWYDQVWKDQGNQ